MDPIGSRTIFEPSNVCHNPISRMRPFLYRYFPLCCVAVLAIGGLVFLISREEVPEKTDPPIAEIKPTPDPSTSQPTLSALATPPDWSALDIFQKTITRSDFERLLTTVFTVGEGWKNYIQIEDTLAIIRKNYPDTGDSFVLDFATDSPPKPIRRHWRSTAELPPAPAGKPLDGMHIAIDPGHIGGQWAKMEERWFIFGDGKPVTEGDMTLAVAMLLKPRLENLGATVSLVRDKPEPITPIRPDSLITAAERSAPTDQSQESLQRLAERLFYRTAEIHARAQRVNEILKPDLVLCLHFNADAWGDPNNPSLVPNSHLHLLLNGAYNDEEVAFADQRFTLLHKILQGIHDEEASVGATVADTFAQISKLPPYQYLPNSPNVRPVNGHPLLWARNLLANRLYDCPVIFMEPYVMNSVVDYARIQAGDYEGLREVAGEMRPSIFQEYADALTEGLRLHYSSHRQQTE